MTGSILAVAMSVLAMQLKPGAPPHPRLPHTAASSPLNHSPSQVQDQPRPFNPTLDAPSRQQADPLVPPNQQAVAQWRAEAPPLARSLLAHMASLASSKQQWQEGAGGGVNPKDVATAVLCMGRILGGRQAGPLPPANAITPPLPPALPMPHTQRQPLFATTTSGVRQAAAPLLAPGPPPLPPAPPLPLGPTHADEATLNTLMSVARPGLFVLAPMQLARLCQGLGYLGLPPEPALLRDLAKVRYVFWVIWLSKSG